MLRSKRSKYGLPLVPKSGQDLHVPAAPVYAPSLAASGRRRPPQRAAPKNSRRGFFGTPSGRTLARRHLPHRTAPGYRACGYKTASGRPKWLNADPFGLAGGINLYGYVGNNPIGGIDPLGLDILVIVGGQKDGSLNIAGHVGLAVTGQGLFSPGNNDNDRIGGNYTGANVTDYLSQQAQVRGQSLYVIKTTPAQDEIVADFMRKLATTRVNKYPDNCANRVNNALKTAGIDLNAGNVPASTQRALDSLVGQGQVTTAPLPQGSTYIPPFLQEFNPKL